jgi:hypothetical protein
MRCLRSLKASPSGSAIDGVDLSAYSRLIALIGP